jgi:hypothetical protein
MKTHRLILAGLAAAALVLGGAALAAAAPDNKNTETFPVDCEEPLGTIDVTVVEHSNGNPGFAADRKVLVPKLFEGSGAFEVTLVDEEGDPVSVPVPVEFFFEDARGGQGKGHAGKLVTCTFSEAFTEVSPLSAEDAAFLNEVDDSRDWTEHIGELVEFDGEFTGVVHVKVVGKR